MRRLWTLLRPCAQYFFIHLETSSRFITEPAAFDYDLNGTIGEAGCFLNQKLGSRLV
jgi:hypothetical protein